MKLDTYTKAILTVIAFGLMALVVIQFLSYKIQAEGIIVYIQNP